MTDDLRAALLDWYAAKQRLRRMLARTGKPGPALKAAERVDAAEVRLEHLASAFFAGGARAISPVMVDASEDHPGGGAAVIRYTRRRG